MKFAALIIGDEILSGKRADGHLAKVIGLLGARGMELAQATYVGDDPQRITDILRQAFAGSEMVFAFGGIGATPDDHTRQCAAHALGVELELHPVARDLILERMQDIALEQGVPFEPKREDNLHRLHMGCFPRGASIIPNPYNKIAGFSCTGQGGAAVHFFPGFPVMAWPMLEWVLDTHCAQWFERNGSREHSVIVFGAMESTLTPMMESLERRHAVKVFSLPSVDHPEFGKHIELGVKGAPVAVSLAFAEMRSSLESFRLPLGPELVRNR